MALYDRQTSVKATEDELAAWRAAAGKNGLPLQTWMRMILDHAAGIGELDEQLQVAAARQRQEHAANMRASKGKRG